MTGTGEGRSTLRDEGRFIRVETRGLGITYRLDDVTPEDLARSLDGYRHYTGLDPRAQVWLNDGRGLAQLDRAQGEFVIRDVLHSLDALNY